MKGPQLSNMNFIIVTVRGMNWIARLISEDDFMISLHYFWLASITEVIVEGTYSGYSLARVV